MTVALSGTELAAKLGKQFQNAVIESDETSIRITVDSLREIASFLKKTPEFDFNYLTAVTAVDYRDYFEVVYILTSITHNHSLTVIAEAAETRAVTSFMLSIEDGFSYWLWVGVGVAVLVIIGFIAVYRRFGNQ